MEIMQVENVLKNFYLEIISNQLNANISSVLAKIEYTSNDIYGKEIIVPLIINNKDYLFKSELKTIYGNIEISDKAVRCLNTSSFVNLLNSEVENMLKYTMLHISNAFYDEDKKPKYFNENETYNILKLNGLKYLFDENEKYLYGIDREKNKDILPVIKKVKEFNWNEILQIIDENNDEINFMICSPSTKRAYMDYQMEMRQNINVQENGYFKNILFQNLIPIETNINISDNEIYLINTNDFKFHQLCDWKWLENYDHRILKQCYGKPVYNARLVKYGDYICHYPNKQIKIIKE